MFNGGVPVFTRKIRALTELAGGAHRVAPPRRQPCAGGHPFDAIVCLLSVRGIDYIHSYV